MNDNQKSGSSQPSVFRGFLSGLFRGLGLVVAFTVVPFLVLGIVFSFLSSDDDVDFSKPRAKTDHAVGVVELTGEIGVVVDFRKELKRLVDDKSIKAVVVRIDSPGGGVGASEEIYNLIREADGKKPVVCALGSIAASGGLYAAQGCRKVVALRGTMTGSIGVIAMLPMFQNVMDKVGVSVNVVKSGRYKDVGSPFRTMTDEDRALLNRLVDRSYSQFVDVIAQARGMTTEQVRAFADGRIILGDEALELKLIDSIGGVPEAAKISLTAAGINAEPEILFPSPKSGLELLLTGEAFSFLRELGAQLRPRLLYRSFL